MSRNKPDRAKIILFNLPDTAPAIHKWCGAGWRKRASKVINLMDALRRSVEAERSTGKNRAPAASVRERTAKKKPAKSSARHKRAG
jgi:hypothetical protein